MRSVRIILLRKSKKPVYLLIENEKVEIKDASKYWGLGTDELDKKIIAEFGEKQFESNNFEELYAYLFQENRFNHVRL